MFSPGLSLNKAVRFKLAVKFLFFEDSRIETLFEIHIGVYFTLDL